MVVDSTERIWRDHACSALPCRTYDCCSCPYRLAAFDRVVSSSGCLATPWPHSHTLEGRGARGIFPSGQVGYRLRTSTVGVRAESRAGSSRRPLPGPRRRSAGLSWGRRLGSHRGRLTGSACRSIRIDPWTACSKKRVYRAKSLSTACQPSSGRCSAGSPARYGFLYDRRRPGYLAPRYTALRAHSLSRHLSRHRPGISWPRRHTDLPLRGPSRGRHPTDPFGLYEDPTRHSEYAGLRR
jgi:hypothetical protein